jgi:hypothetical protein
MIIDGIVILEDSLAVSYKNKHILTHAGQQLHSLVFIELNQKLISM